VGITQWNVPQWNNLRRALTLWHTTLAIECRRFLSTAAQSRLRLQDQMELIMTQVFQVESSESAMLSASALLESFNSDSPLNDIKAHIAGLTESSALTLVTALVEHGGNAEFCLGGVLETIKEKDWYGDYESFGEFVRVTCGFDIRQAQHLTRTYRYLVDKQISWTTVKPLGWTKLRLLVNAEELTAENAADWVAKAAGKAMTVRALDNELKFVPALPKHKNTVLNLVQPSSFTASTPVSEPVDSEPADGGADEQPDNETADEYHEQQTADAHAADYEYSMLKNLMQSAGADTVRALFEELFPGVPLAQAGE
jgi:hypothetical protein